MLQIQVALLVFRVDAVTPKVSAAKDYLDAGGRPG
jgi:hypothetical protein